MHSMVQSNTPDPRFGKRWDTWRHNTAKETTTDAKEAVPVALLQIIAWWSEDYLHAAHTGREG